MNCTVFSGDDDVIQQKQIRVIQIDIGGHSYTIEDVNQKMIITKQKLQTYQPNMYGMLMGKHKITIY